jgi:beta-galactosidase
LHHVSFMSNLLLTSSASRIFSLLLIFVSSSAHLTWASNETNSPRAVYNFNPGWKLFVGDPDDASRAGFDDSDWKSVTLPHAWNEDAAFRVAIHKLPTGTAWYRKHFKLPASSAGKKIFLEFEGVRQGGEFYLNGHPLGRHENGVMAVGFDVSEFLNPPTEENVLAVRTDNAWDYREKSTNQRFQWNDRNFNANYGGIVKNVRLHVTSKLHQTLPLYSNLKTTGCYIYAHDFDLVGRAATITAESEVRNDLEEARTVTYEVALVDADGQVVKQFAGKPSTIPAGETQVLKASARVAGLNFWSWGYGYLYDVETKLKVDGIPVDVVRTRTGFRQTEFANGLIKLNGRVIQMKGYAQRTTNEWPALGSSVPPWLSDFSNGLIVEGNGNLVRWMHVTPSKQDVESCDRVGLLQAMPAGDSEGDARGRQWQQRLEVMRDAIIYNRNNPSIIFYEAGNERVSESHMKEMKALRDQLDPHGGRAVGCREMLDSQVAEYGGEMLYINKSARLPFWAMEYSRDEGLRKYWDELSPPFHKEGEGPLYKNENASDYNHNQDSHAIENVKRWYDYYRERPGTGTRVSSGGVNIIFSDSNTHFRGAENYRRSGEVDPLRIPKDGFWAHQVMWDGWVQVERPRAHILGHWNYPSGTQKSIYVVSSAEQVELFLNGKSLGQGKQSDRFLFTFENIMWQPGILHAVGLDHLGKKICEAEKRTAGAPVATKLTAITDPGGLLADGADVALIEVEVVDAEGERCPTDLSMLEFDLSGPAEWRGGLGQGPENYILSRQLPVECGVNRVLLRSLPEAGTITLTAKSAGLAPATIALESHPLSMKDGLADVLPGTRLPSNLSRGPTPLGPAFEGGRTAVPIIAAKAGANSDQSAASYDDNEISKWSNDNLLATGWISYELVREATITEATMKLSGWRQRSYPITVFVDGQEVFRGRTSRSLGYVTIPLKPTQGRTVRIELTGASTAQDAYNIKELKNDKNGSTGDEGQGRGTLSIVEIEFYESQPRQPKESFSAL